MQNLEPFLTFGVKNAIVQHLLDTSPQEACGYIQYMFHDYTYVPCENVHPEPGASFRFTKEDSAHIQTDDNVIAFVHTHPIGPANPSKRDMEIQKLVGKPSVIASLSNETGVMEIFSFGDHLIDLPLDDRVFRYGVTDCYEAIRSWRWQNEGVKMDAFPRHNGWWDAMTGGEFPEDDRDMYIKNFQSQGYVAFDPNFSDPMSDNHPRLGDLMLMKLGPTFGDVVNHAGIYVGNNMVYHHRFGKKSGTTPVGYLPAGTIRMWARQA